MGVVVDLRQIVVRLVYPSEKQTYQALMAQHHYLGSLPKIGETLWYVACWHDQWVALLSFSASALKCAVRDSWIGWGMHNRYDRLKLIVNNSRFLILPDWHRPNLGSRVLSLCSRRLNADWQETFGHAVVLLETFVDSQRFSGTVYKAANWIYVGDTKGYRRIRTGYGPENISCLRRFVIGIIKSKKVASVAQKMRELNRNIRLVFDYLRMTKNTCRSIP
jgi:hypothetical protein